jgi:hypothetical protein
VTFPKVFILLQIRYLICFPDNLDEMVMMFCCGPGVTLLKEPNELSFLMRFIRKGIKDQWGEQCIFMENKPYF